MQNRYVGDIGDFAKYALLRALIGDRQLGVAWYLYPDERTTGDGRHIDYLKHPEKWRWLDQDVFDCLRELVSSKQRNVAALKDSGLLPGAVFADSLLQTYLPSSTWAERREWRFEWFNNVVTKLADCDMVFADPDNGLCLDANYSASRQKDQKRLPLGEAQKLSNGRPTVIYHHNSRFPGGHRREIMYWMQNIPGCTHALYWRRYSNRTFFVINPDQRIINRLTEFAMRWKGTSELIIGDYHC